MPSKLRRDPHAVAELSQRMGVGGRLFSKEDPHPLQIFLHCLLRQERRDLVGLDRHALSGIFEVSVSLPEETLDLLAHNPIIGQPSGERRFRLRP